mmetsp:Transcript_58597/g.188357  ORF Transcript_58597/g.188357 Transcript_58597/m.188357 type:complete len:109 (+) Transcript_58597:1063-1389(+)
MCGTSQVPTDGISCHVRGGLTAGEGVNAVRALPVELASGRPAIQVSIEASRGQEPCAGALGRASSGALAAGTCKPGVALSWQADSMRTFCCGIAVMAAATVQSAQPSS